MQGLNQMQSYGDTNDTRFLKFKFILVKDNNTGRGSMMT